MKPRKIKEFSYSWKFKLPKFDYSFNFPKHLNIVEDILGHI